jgi:hypothetical protein
MQHLDLDDEQADAFAALLTNTIDGEAILAKFDPPTPRPEPLPLLPGGTRPRVGRGRHRP